MKQSPIFIKAYELSVWLLRHTEKFRRNQRFALAFRMEQAAVELNRNLVKAARLKGSPAMEMLGCAQECVDELNLYGRFGKDLDLLAPNQYEFLSSGLQEVGRLLGGWKRSVETRSSASQDA